MLKLKKLTQEEFEVEIRKAASQAAGRRYLFDGWDRCFWGQFWHNQGVPDSAMKIKGIFIDFGLNWVYIPSADTEAWDVGRADTALETTFEVDIERINDVIQKINSFNIE